MLEFVIESWSLYVVGALVIITRLAVRFKMVGFSGLKPDDYLMVIALLVYSVETTMAHLVGLAGGTNFGLTPEQRAALTPLEISNRVLGTKAFMTGWFTYSGLIYILKFCMLFFFERVTFGLDRQVLIWWCFGTIGVTWITIILTLFLTCRPWYKSFQVVPDPGLTCQIENPVYYIVIFVFNLLTDGMIISVPLPLLLKTRMPLKRKIFLIVMFSAGGFVMLAAILRCIFSLTDSKNSSTAAVWACRETFVAVLVGNAPMIRPIFSKRFWDGRIHSTTGKSRSNDASDHLSVELSSRKLKKNSVTLDSDSIEHIVDSGPALMIKTEMTYEVSTQEADLQSYAAGGSLNSRVQGDIDFNGNRSNGYSATVCGNV